MSHAANGRRIDRLGRTGWARGNSLMSNVLGAERLDRRRRAALALVKFARVLAGTEEEAPMPAPMQGESPPQSVAARLPANRLSPAPPRRPPVRTWDLNNRPGPHDVLTWQEAMQVPWLDGSTANRAAKDET